MDHTLWRTLLLDYYGELLTEKQRDCYDLHYNQDLSLQEIAEQNGSTRQAVWLLIRRAEEILRNLEEKTGLVARAVRRREQLEALLGTAARLPECPEKAQLIALLENVTD